MPTHLLDLCRRASPHDADYAKPSKTRLLAPFTSSPNSQSSQPWSMIFASALFSSPIKMLAMQARPTTSDQSSYWDSGIEGSIVASIPRVRPTKSHTKFTLILRFAGVMYVCSRLGSMAGWSASTLRSSLQTFQRWASAGFAPAGAGVSTHPKLHPTTANDGTEMIDLQ